jgi:hypothetical protein
MKRQIIITIILLAATVMITFTYFKHLNPPGRRASEVIDAIPASAAFVFEFNNDGSFFEIYDKSELFTAITGGTKMRELKTLRNILLNNNAVKSYFLQQDIFISLHPQPNDSLEYLITLPSTHAIEQAALNQLKVNKTGWSVTETKIAGKNGFEIRIDSLQKPFYLSEKQGHIWAGSFSKLLLEESLNFKVQNTKAAFVQLPDQQSANLLANLYVNYQQLTPLLTSVYRSENIDIWKGLDMLPAATALSLNYKSDALMFNGFTTFNKKQATSYLNLFRGMKPVENTLNDIFPVTTAYSNSYAVDNVKQFEKLLADWQQKAGLYKEKTKLFTLIKKETGVQFNQEFDALLANEFTVITTRFQEKLAIIKVNNGAKLRPFVNNISTMVNEEVGQFNYNQVPLFMLGDALTPFRRPYFMIIDNYLVLANTARELNNYKENYFNNAFLSKDEEYTNFNNLLAQRSNVCFFIHFKNAGNIFKRTLKRNYAAAYQQQPGFKNYYAAAYQLSASDNEFYTNLCVKLIAPDSVSLGK